MRPDFLPGDGTLAAIRAEHEIDREKRRVDAARVNPFTFDRVEFLLVEYDRRVAELLAANNREVDRRREAEAECERLRRLVELPRASDLIDTIRRLIGSRAEWKVADLRLAIRESGIESDEKTIANGLAYLTRRKKVRRIGYGRYAPADGSIGMEKEP